MVDRIRRTSGLIAGQVPTLLVLAVLGGVGWWGYRTNWSAPKLSQLTEASANQQAEDWCSEHSVPESKCVACKPQLLGVDPKDWCREHGVPESKCTICHPELLAKGEAADWCAEHGVPESNCTICNPDIPHARLASASVPPSAKPLAEGDACCPAEQADAKTVPVAQEPHGEHGHAEHADAPHERTEPAGDDAHKAHAHATAQGPRDPRTCQTHTRRVQFASAESVSKAGIQLAKVEQQPMTEHLTANGEIDYNRTLVAQVGPKVAGTIWRVEKEVGQPVKKGEVLALIDAIEVGKTKAELLAASAALEVKTQALERVKTSAGSGFRTQAELQTAAAERKEAEVRQFNARQALINLGLPGSADASLDEQAVRFLGLPAAVVETLDAETTTANLLPLTAPLDGVVIDRQAVAGEVVEAGKTLLVVADTRRMWVTLDVPLAQVRRVAIGQEVQFHIDGEAGEVATGKVSWISTAVDERTRTVKVRADVENPDSRLLAHTFGKARILISRQEHAAVVPSEAVQWEGCCHLVFVKVADDLFQPRKVKLGARSGEYMEVLVGVLPGETIATVGSHVLKSEILKGNLGDTCGGH